MNRRHKTHFHPDGPYHGWYCNIHRVPHRRPDQAPYRRTNIPEAVTCDRCHTQRRRHPRWTPGPGGPDYGGSPEAHPH